jgi:hypothetical protein
MRYRLYEGQTCWLITPEFLLPPKSTARYEPLVQRGYIEETEFAEGDITQIQQAIAQHFYAALPSILVAHLRPAIVDESSASD